MKPPKQPFWVHCGACFHSWVLLYTPILLEDALKHKDTKCPKCKAGIIRTGKQETLCQKI
jgi:hypothetical protein